VLWAGTTTSSPTCGSRSSPPAPSIGLPLPRASRALVGPPRGMGAPPGKATAARCTGRCHCLSRLGATLCLPAPPPRKPHRQRADEEEGGQFGRRDGFCGRFRAYVLPRSVQLLAHVIGRRVEMRQRDQGAGGAVVQVDVVAARSSGAIGGESNVAAVSADAWIHVVRAQVGREVQSGQGDLAPTAVQGDDRVAVPSPPLGFSPHREPIQRTERGLVVLLLGQRWSRDYARRRRLAHDPAGQQQGG
jgi:hypothetical protein